MLLQRSIVRNVMLAVLVTVALPFYGKAQQYRLVPFVGYSLQESFDFAGKRGVIQPSGHFGMVFEYRIKRNYSIEFMYQRQETITEFNDSISHRLINTAIGWFLVGGLNYHQFGTSKFSSIAGLYVGVGNVANQDKDVSEARFAAGLKAGIVYDISPSFGIRLQSQALLMLGGPGSVWGVDNSGTYGTIVQAGFSGGLIFSFGKKHLTKPGEDS